MTKITNILFSENNCVDTFIVYLGVLEIDNIPVKHTVGGYVNCISALPDISLAVYDNRNK